VRKDTKDTVPEQVSDARLLDGTTVPDDVDNPFHERAHSPPDVDEVGL
jgi:hypothetical protein